MSNRYSYRIPRGEEELREYASVSAQAFSEDEEPYFELLPSLGEELVRIVACDGEIAAGLIIYDMGQFFGGRSVPMWGVSCVAVAPHHRGKGVGAELMRGCLLDVRAAGVPLSTLFPATRPLYQRLGWEIAGTRPIYEASVAALPPSASDVEIRVAREEDGPAIRAIYRRAARGANGNLDRNDQIWRRIRTARGDDRVHAYVVEEGGQPTGYIYFTQNRPGARTFRYELIIKDLVFDSTRAGQRLLTLLAHHRSMVGGALLAAGPASPLLFLSRESALRQTSRFDWMLRIVDVKAALEGRGWPVGLQTRVDLEVVDDVLADNGGAYRIEVSGGDCRVERISSAPSTIDVRGLAGLYSSMLTPSDLRKVGYLRGDGRDDETLAALFAGPAPWMPDIF